MIFTVGPRYAGDKFAENETNLDKLLSYSLLSECM